MDLVVQLVLPEEAVIPEQKESGAIKEDPVLLVQQEVEEPQVNLVPMELQEQLAKEERPETMV